MNQFAEEVERIKKLVSDGKSKEALKVLSNLDVPFIKKEVILLNSRYNKLMAEKMGGRLDNKEANIDLARIDDAIINLADRVLEGPTSKESAQLLAQNKKVRNRVIGGFLVAIIFVMGLYFFNSATLKKKDEKAWVLANNQNSIAAFETYLSDFPKGKYNDKATTIIDQRKSDLNAWNNTIKENTISAFEAYLNSYPNGLYYQTADSILKYKNAELNAWRAAQTSQTTDAFKAYINTYPEGVFFNDAITILNEREQKDKKAWDEANKGNSISAYQTYIRNYPNGIYVNEAQTKLEEKKKEAKEIEDRQRREAEARQKELNAWQTAQNGNSIASYTTYLKQYPKGAYSTTAQKAINDKKANTERKVRLTMVRLVCEKSDDEGSNNNADMNVFDFKFTARQACNKDASKNKTIINNASIYYYNDKAITIAEGEHWKDNNRYVDFIFDNEHCNELHINITGYANEDDGSSKDENASASFNIPNPSQPYGSYSFKLTSNDFVFRCEFKLDKIGW